MQPMQAIEVVLHDYNYVFKFTYGSGNGRMSGFFCGTL